MMPGCFLESCTLATETRGHLQTSIAECQANEADPKSFQYMHVHATWNIKHHENLDNYVQSQCDFCLFWWRFIHIVFPVEFQWFSEVVHPYSHWFDRPIRNVSNIMLLAKQVWCSKTFRSPFRHEIQAAQGHGYHKSASLVIHFQHDVFFFKYWHPLLWSEPLLRQTQGRRTWRCNT